MTIQDVPISELKFAEYNPRKINEQQERDLTRSLSDFGQVDPIIVNSNPERNNVIIGGHQRARVWAKLGHTTIQVVYIDLPLHRERELNIRLNKNTGEWDWGALQEFFKKDELMNWGFTESDLFGRFKQATKGDDDAPGLPAEPKTKTGDIYQLGPHRLICGDATSLHDLDAIIQKEIPGMVFTDPPYNVNYAGTGKDTSRTILNDNLEQDQFRALLTNSFKAMASFTRPDAPLYCCYASRTHREFEDSLNAAGYIVKNQIIWVKTVAGMVWGDYRWKHEPMFYAIQQGQDPSFFAGRMEWTAWDHSPSDEELLRDIRKNIKKEEDGKSTVWRFARESQYTHPTQKPVALIERAISNSLHSGDIVLDPFAGSGTTMIAAEKTGRVARLVEMDPSFCDVIVQRYVDFCTANKREFTISKNGVDIKQYNSTS